MKLKQYNVMVVPKNGQPFYVVIGGFANVDAWSKAQMMYPDCSCLVMN